MADLDETLRQQIEARNARISAANQAKVDAQNVYDSALAASQEAINQKIAAAEAKLAEAQCVYDAEVAARKAIVAEKKTALQSAQAALSSANADLATAKVDLTTAQAATPDIPAVPAMHNLTVAQFEQMTNQYILRLINQLRESRGLAPVVINADVQFYTDGHAKVSNDNYFATGIFDAHRRDDGFYHRYSFRE